MMLPAYKYYDDRSLLGSYCAAALLGVETTYIILFDFSSSFLHLCSPPHPHSNSVHVHVHTN